MDRATLQIAALTTCLILLGSGGCSTLGISLYPSMSTLTKEAQTVLDESRIPSAIPRENAKSVLPPHKLQPGDALLIEPTNLERDLRLPADQIVLADGTVDLGPYGRIVIAGRSLEEAELLIEEQIVFQLKKQAADCQEVAGEEVPTGEQSMVPTQCNGVAINVRLLEPVHEFYVLGEVNAPGSYPLTGSETVLDAIVSAGGLTSSANPCKILLARPTDPCECRVTLPVCYREIVQMGNTATNYQLQPGDRVFVSTRSCMDEMMFWKAGRSCPRCAGCNRACANPEMVMARQMSPVSDTMISPGSVGWSPTPEDLLHPSRLVPPAGQDLGDPPSEFKNLLNSRGTPDSTPGPSRSQVDGELDFDPLVEQ